MYNLNNIAVYLSGNNIRQIVKGQAFVTLGSQNLLWGFVTSQTGREDRFTVCFHEVKIKSRRWRLNDINFQ